MWPRTASAWYSQLGVLTRAGIPIPNAIRSGRGPDRRFSTTLADRLDAGEDPRDVWSDARAELGPADAVMLAAGQLSGRFPETCDALAARHAERARTLGRLAAGLAYPLLLLHAVAALSPLMAMVAEGACALVPALFIAARNLAAIWGVIGVGLWLALRRPAWFASLVRPLPLWGGAMRHAALAGFAGTLSALLKSGVVIGEAWRFAGAASGDPRIRAASIRVVAIVEANCAPGPELPAMRAFPEDFCALYAAGERTGTLEQRLDKLRDDHAEASAARAATAAAVYPVFIYLIVAGVAAVAIVSAWAGHFQSMANLMSEAG